MKSTKKKERDDWEFIDGVATGLIITYILVAFMTLSLVIDNWYLFGLFIFNFVLLVSYKVMRNEELRG